jgi:hypothetical protein
MWLFHELRQVILDEAARGLEFGRFNHLLDTAYRTDLIAAPQVAQLDDRSNRGRCDYNKRTNGCNRTQDFERHITPQPRDLIGFHNLIRVYPLSDCGIFFSSTWTELSAVPLFEPLKGRVPAINGESSRNFANLANPLFC